MHQSGGLMLVPGWTGTTPYVSLRETAIEFLLGCQKRKRLLSSDKRCFLFNEINPFGICEMSLGREILLRNVKCAAARSGFISFHWMRQYPISQRPSGHYFTFCSRQLVMAHGAFFARLKNSLFCGIISSENKNLMVR